MCVYKGVFWVKDTESTVCVKAHCDTCGSFIDLPGINPVTLSKNKTNFNHKNVWQTLDKSITGNKPYKYYPRGRVEIKNGKAVIYANAGIATEKLKDWAVSEFNLTKEHGIKSIALKADGSEHYKSHFD